MGDIGGAGTSGGVSEYGGGLLLGGALMVSMVGVEWSRARVLLRGGEEPTVCERRRGVRGGALGDDLDGGEGTERGECGSGHGARGVK